MRGIAESLFFPAKGQGPSDALRSEVSFKRETGFLSEDGDAFDAPERIGLLRPLYEGQDDRELDFEAPADMHSRSFSLEWDMADFEVPTDVEQPPRKRFDALLGYSPAISPVLGTAYAPQLPRAVKYSLRRTPAEDGLVIKAAYDSRQPPPVTAPAQGAHGSLVFVAGGVRVTGQLSGPGPVVTAALWIADESTGTPLTKWPTVFITPDGQREESATDEQGRVEFQLGSGLGTLVLGPSGEIVLPILVEESRGSP